MNFKTETGRSMVEMLGFGQRMKKETQTSIGFSIQRLGVLDINVNVIDIQLFVSKENPHGMGGG